MFGVKVYGTDWCKDTQRTRALLERLGVAYEYVDIEADERAREWVLAHNDGKEQKPTVDVAGQILSVPTDHDLTSALRERGLMA